jgi:hypothetical protein
MDIVDTSHQPKPARRWYQLPALWALLAAVLIIVAAFIPALWQMRLVQNGSAPTSARDAPWESQIAADGSLWALGLRLPGATLADAQSLWNGGLQVIVRVPREGETALEATVETARPGGVQGRLVLHAAATPEQLARWASRPAKEDRTSSLTRHLSLQPDDLREALATPIRLVAFVPQARLDEATAKARFGEPQRVLREGDKVQHWLYPARGMALMLNPEGRDVLQFVPPAQFQVLVATPLKKALGS